MSKRIKKAAVSYSPAVREKSKIITSVSALNPCQKKVLKSIADHENHICFISGIAGVGKTFLAVSWGLEQLLKGNFKKMILTRPYVEAGEKLGFLPGSFEDKISPFMIPIMDVFHEYLSIEDIKLLFEDTKILVLPLAYMRGVSFKDSFVILDEAQNTTITQMNLFLTRIGKNSKMVITGDQSQSDLGPKNGLIDAINRLQGIKGVDFIELDANSIVRHPIIGPISERYAKKD